MEEHWNKVEANAVAKIRTYNMKGDLNLSAWATVYTNDYFAAVTRLQQDICEQLTVCGSPSASPCLHLYVHTLKFLTGHTVDY